MLEAGKKIGGRYKIIRLIGTGGMANVYLGNDLILDRDVAIKVLRFDFRNNPEALRRFQREALSATQLIHPNIVGVYDVDEEDGLQYIVMEYVKGTDLKKYIEQNGRVNPEDAMYIMNQVLSAMALAHRNRIIHRDIKPQNILIDQDKHVKVTDFGIAVALSDTSITQTNTLLGSVHYLSPEQARGSMATIKSDIYALGIVLYELLSGEVPFDGESAVSIALKHFQEAMPSIRKKYPEIPQSLENVILKATAKEPADRYDSCEEMMEDLETVLNPSRVHEPVFSPGAMLDKTKVIQPIQPVATETQTEQAEKADTMKVVPAKVAPEGGERKPDKKKKKKGRNIFFVILFILLAGLAFFFIWSNREPETVLIPEIENVNENTARRMLEEANLVVGDLKKEYHDKIAEDFVIRTSPAAGEAVLPQSTVDLVISSGKEPVVIENYLGETYSEVRDLLRKKGFFVEREDEFDDEAEAGVIIDQSISEGTELVPDGRTIILTVSMGEEVFTMSDLEGYTKVSVQDYAERYGLKVDFEEETSEKVAEGLVISQSISPQSNFSRGDSLVVTLSSGPAKPEYKVFSKKIVIPFEASSSNGNEGNEGNESASEESKDANSKPEDSSSEEAVNHVVIYMKDADHSIDDIFREFNMSSDQEIVLNFRILEGEAGAYRVLRDGKKIMEETNLTE